MKKLPGCFTITAFSALVLFSVTAQSQTSTGTFKPLFPKGVISSADNHTGIVWLKELSEADSTFHYSVAFATFDAGAKLDWHIHPAGQVLLITDGSCRRCDQMPAGRRTLAWCITRKQFCLYCHHLP